MIPVVTWGGYLTMGYFPNSTTSTKSSSFKFVCRFWAWLLVVVPPTHWRSSKVSEMNCDKPARWSGGPTTLQSKEKQRKVELEAICTLLPQETPPNDDDWAPRRNSRHFGRFLRQFGLHWFWHYPPPACAPVGPNNWKRVIWLHFTLFPNLFLAQNLIHCFSVFSSILAQVYLTFPFESSATSSKISISLRKWKLHHLRRVSIKLEGRRNGNVEIENPSSGKQNTKRKKENWRFGKRKSQRWKTQSKKKESIKSYAGDF